MKRRQYLGALSIPALLALTGGAGAQTLPEPQGFEPADTWFGPIDDRPEPDWVGFDNAEGTVAYIATDTGEIASLDVGGQAGWQTNDVHLASHPESAIPPAGVEEGQMGWNSDRKVPWWFDGDDVEYPVVGDDAILSDQAVENTTTETTVFSAGLDAGSMKAGRVYEVKLYGSYSTNDGSDTFTLRFYAGGTVVASVTSVAANVSNAPITAKLTVTVRSEGASGTIRPHTEAVFDDEHMDQHHAEESIDTTAANSFEASVEWGVAESGDRVEIGQGYMKEIA